MEPAEHDVLLERLTAADGPDDAVADLLLAAADSADALRALIDGAAAPAREVRAGDGATAEPARVYLEQIRVEGFRGVGPVATLPVEPGPGLTLVSGRNGSGKSSFAEALELLLTGRNLRWDGKPTAWQEGWRNVHAPDPCTVSARLRMDGEAEPVTVTQTWAARAALGAAQRTVAGAREDWSALGWDEPLTRYRPLLSYNELGAMFSDRAADLYETLSAVLGLEPFEAVLETVRQERLSREKAGKGESSLRTALKAALQESGDERAAPLRALVATQQRDLDAIDALLGADDGPGEETTSLQELVRLTLPDADELAALAATVTDGQAAVDAAAGGGHERDRHHALLLRAALAYHADHGAEAAECPVCGAADAGWPLRAEVDAGALEAATAALRAAHLSLEQARAAFADAFHAQTPTALRAAATAGGLDTEGASRAWDDWALTRDPASAERARAAAAAAQAVAAAELSRREDHWRPLRDDAVAWLRVAREERRGKAAVKRCQAAEAWLKGDIATLRTERMQPVADAAQANWEQLRHASNVALGSVELKQSGNRRSVVFDVTVDGTSASAFGVMSQGELSALAISIFLPRASLPESPFGFILIDDPVQSMDPAKVDGLAQVLAQAATTRQVVVLIHDDRLRVALERLQLPARLVEIKRRAGSTVDVVAGGAPSARHLEDAVALVRTEDLPAGVRARVVPGFCRSAIEAACATRIRRTRLGDGIPHADVELALTGLTSTITWLTAALGLEPQHAAQARELVRSRAGDDAAWALGVATSGAHEGFTGDDERLVRGTRALVRALETP